MDIRTYRRDPNHQKDFVEESSSPFYKPEAIVTEYGIDITTEQNGVRGVEIRISLSHADIFKLLIKASDLTPDSTEKIVRGVVGYLDYHKSSKSMEN